jgi:hypothetical protein
MRGIKTHALGMANGDLWELDRLAWEGVVSCDSSAPIWRGLFGQTLNERADRDYWDRDGKPVDFDHKIFSSIDPSPTILHNINLVLSACGKEPFRG